ncbi:PREDICTED: CD2 antigen cytoplasmic tail-binding protein 2 [Tarenaya hassleriana]|uniref:CD2 antigen cytoplasmic tail-binding protein 2 n=1 Tax=Tarenaya hassleriana TaxID=28532 RepID=UPI00053C90AB|nr:PREDICTED: CD2 antigen cytoplasmic tail-binding protein 2 [Tarenaya hassleriana]
MEGESRNKLKRSFVDEGDSSDQPAQKRVRFPKGKKTKPTYEVFHKGDAEAVPIDPRDPRHAAKERAKRRNQITTELFTEDGEGFLDDVTAAEETYEDDGNRSEDGIHIEAFNLNKEREEGYFDADGNFVEYAREKEIKDAWLDSIEANPKYMGRSAANDSGNDEDSGNENTVDELSQEEIGTMKRRIANILQPGETVLQALRRLKGNSNNRKEKMSPETKHIFDQLTEDADKLIQNGEYDVYHEKQDVFEREAEGYEKLAEARRRGTSASVSDDMFSDANDLIPDNPLHSGPSAGPSVSNGAAAMNNPNNDSYDIFTDDGNGSANPSSNGSGLPAGSITAYTNMTSEAGADGSDYVYDESSGYYYSSSLGYYYDPNTGLYCSAATGKWYKYDEETKEYEEVNEMADSV